MADDFVAALIALRNASVDEVIERLHRLFTAITAMNADEVVAAWQTVEVTTKSRDIWNDSAVKNVMAALYARMQYLRGNGNDGGLNALFYAVTRRQLYYTSIYVHVPLK